MSQDTVRVRVVGRQFRHGGEEYLRGDELEVPERAIDGWERRLERIDDQEDSAEDTAEEDAALSAEDLDPHPADLTVDELGERVAEVDDAALLATIRQAEAGRDDPRSTALDVIDDRLGELEG